MKFQKNGATFLCCYLLAKPHQCTLKLAYINIITYTERKSGSICRSGHPNKEEDMLQICYRVCLI